MGTNTRRRRRFIRHAAGIILGAAILAAAIFYADLVNTPATHIKAWFLRADGSSTARFWLELAVTEGERSKGLMFRKSLPEDEGMIFIYPSQRRQVFWMKNTFIPLDMIFIDESSKIVGILEEVPVQNDSPRSVEKPSKLVIELIAGSVKKHQIATGDTLVTRGPLPIASN